VLLITVLNEALRGLAIWRPDALPFEISHLEYILMGGLLALGVWLNTHVKSGTTVPVASGTGKDRIDPS
jgi:hypothetical protein